MLKRSFYCCLTKYETKHILILCLALFDSYDAIIPEEHKNTTVCLPQHTINSKIWLWGLVFGDDDSTYVHSGVIIQTLLPINVIIDINNIPYPIYKPKKTRDWFTKLPSALIWVHTRHICCRHVTLPLCYLLYIFYQQNGFIILFEMQQIEKNV